MLESLECVEVTNQRHVTYRNRYDNISILLSDSNNAFASKIAFTAVVHKSQNYFQLFDLCTTIEILYFMVTFMVRPQNILFTFTPNVLPAILTSEIDRTIKETFALILYDATSKLTLKF